MATIGTAKLPEDKIERVRAHQDFIQKVVSYHNQKVVPKTFWHKVCSQGCWRKCDNFLTTLHFVCSKMDYGTCMVRTMGIGSAYGRRSVSAAAPVEWPIIKG